MGHKWDDLPCIDCGAPLSEATPAEWPRSHRCCCGLIYADELLDDADRTVWQQIIDGDGYTTRRERDELLVTRLA